MKYLRMTFALLAITILVSSCELAPQNDIPPLNKKIIKYEENGDRHGPPEISPA